MARSEDGGINPLRRSSGRHSYPWARREKYLASQRHPPAFPAQSYALKIELEPGCSRLKSEIKVLLVCSGVPTFRDAGDVDGRAYIVQELLGPSLHTASMEHEGGIWPFMEVKVRPRGNLCIGLLSWLALSVPPAAPAMGSLC